MRTSPRLLCSHIELRRSHRYLCLLLCSLALNMLRTHFSSFLYAFGTNLMFWEQVVFTPHRAQTRAKHGFKGLPFAPNIACWFTFCTPSPFQRTSNKTSALFFHDSCASENFYTLPLQSHRTPSHASVFVSAVVWPCSEHAAHTLFFIPFCRFALSCFDHFESKCWPI